MNEQAPDPARALDAARRGIEATYEADRVAADEHAQRLGYAIANDPDGDHSRQIRRVREASAVAAAKRECLDIVGGYASGALVAVET